MIFKNCSSSSRALFKIYYAQYSNYRLEPEDPGRKKRYICWCPPQSGQPPPPPVVVELPHFFLSDTEK